MTVPRRSKGPAILLVLAVSLLPAVLVVVAPTSAGAQTEQDPEPVELTLRAIDGVISGEDADTVSADTVSADTVNGATGPKQLHTSIEVSAGDRERTDLRLTTTVFTRAADVDDLRGAVNGTGDTTVYSSTSTAIPDMPAGTTRLIDSAIDAGTLALTGDDRAGVYPVQLQIFEGADPVGALTSSLVVLPVAGPDPLRTTMVVRADADALPLRGDTPQPSLEAVLDADGPLLTLTRDLDQAVADGSSAGLTMVLSGRLLGDLQRMSDGFIRPDFVGIGPDSRIARRAASAVQTLQRVAVRADTEILAFPFGPADLVALVEGGLSEEALRLVLAGPQSVTEVTTSETTSSIIVPPDGLDALTLAALGPVGAQAVLMDSQYLTFASDDALEPVRQLRTADGGDVRLLVPDRDLSQLLADPEDIGTPAVIQQLLAETALEWLEGESRSTPRTSAVLLAIDPLKTDVPPGIVTEVTRAMAQAPWLRPVSLTELRTRTSPSRRLVRLAYPPQSTASELPPDYINELGLARAALAPLRAMLPDGDTQPEQFAESLADVASVQYRSPQALPFGRARSRQVVNRLQQLSGAVAVQESAPVTLTSTTGEVPVIITNSSDVPLNVRATVQATRFAFPEGSTQGFTLNPSSSRLLTFEVQSLNPGGFAPITVTIDDPGGQAVLNSTTISVRSTAVPIVGLVAIAGSVLVLLVWGFRQTRDRRERSRRRESASEHGRRRTAEDRTDVA